MKKKLIPLCLTVVLIFAAGCGKNKKAGAEEGSLDADSSYAFGMFIASQYEMNGVTFDYDALLEGFKDFIRRDTRMSNDAAEEKIQAVYMAAMRRVMETEEDFLSENGKKPGITSTSSGLQYEIIKQGSGQKPRVEDTVRVHYKGTLLNGTVFDSSYDRGQPAEFPLGGVIPGWVEGLQLMNEGSSFRFYIPSALAYRDQNLPNIPPFSTLIFEVELLTIVNE